MVVSVHKKALEDLRVERCCLDELLIGKKMPGYGLLGGRVHDQLCTAYHEWLPATALPGATQLILPIGCKRRSNPASHRRSVTWSLTLPPHSPQALFEVIVRGNILWNFEPHPCMTGREVSSSCMSLRGRGSVRQTSPNRYPFLHPAAW